MLNVASCPTDASNILPITHAGNRQRHGQQRNRDHHALDRTTQLNAKKCQSLFVKFAVSVGGTPAGQCQNAGRADDLGWQRIRPFICPSYRGVYDIVVPVLIAKQLSPQDIKTDDIDYIIYEMEIFCRISKDFEKNYFRRIRGLFGAFIKALKMIDPAIRDLYQLDDLMPLPSSHLKLDQMFSMISSDVLAEINQFSDHLTIRKQARTKEHKFQIDIKHCCTTLIRNGYPVTKLEALLEDNVLQLLVTLWQREYLPDQTILAYLQALRWFATKIKRNRAAADQISQHIQRFRLKVPNQDVVLDPKRYIDLARPERMSKFVSDMMAVAQSGGSEGQGRRQVALSAGACLGIVSLVTLILPAQLPRIRFGDDGQARWDFSNCDPALEKDERLEEALKVPSVRFALEAFVRLFASHYGRLPQSLADGATKERNYLTVMPSRLDSALLAIDCGMTARELSTVVTTILIINGYSDQEAARSAGYRNLMTFRRRYAPILRLVTIMKNANIR